MSNTDLKCALGWSAPTITSSVAFGFFLGPTLMTISLVAAVITSVIIFGLSTYLMRIRKGATGGMESGPMISLGILVLAWVGSISSYSSFAEYLWYLPGFTVALFLSGVYCVYRGLYEGPVWGWKPKTIDSVGTRCGTGNTECDL